MSRLVVSTGNLDCRDQVFASIGAKHADRNLATGKDNGLGEILEHEAQGRGGVGHRIGAMQDDEAIVAVVIFADQLGQRHPMVGLDIRRVDDGIHGLHLQVHLQAFQRGKLLVDSAKIERDERAGVRIGLHADRTAGVDDKNR